jgi:photosystem II stability/assembly factor-like uncharacterized protein
MKRTLVFLFLVFFILNTKIINPQSGWIWLNPIPTGINLTSNYFINSNTGFVVGLNGVTIKTINGGINWLRQESNTNFSLTSVFFPSPNVGYISSQLEDVLNVYSSQIIKTTNGGINWVIKAFPNNRLRSLFFLNELTGFASGVRSEMNGGVIYKTTDGANSWTQQAYYPYAYDIRSIYFVNQNTGFAGSFWNKLMRTTNGGNNWDTSSVGGHNTFNINSVFFINNSIGYIAGSYGKIYMSSDGGVNWIPLNSNTTKDLNSIHFRNLNTGFVVGKEGLFLRTTNSGINWESSTFQNTLQDITIFNSDTAYCVGERGTIIKTINSGANWDFKSFNSPVLQGKFLKSICFSNISTAFIAGDNRVLKSIDNGSTWNLLDIDSNYYYKNLYFLNSNTGFASGGYTTWNAYGSIRYAKIYKTTNGGNNWVLKYGLNYERYHYTQFIFTSPNVGWSVGNHLNLSSNEYSGGIIKTTNGGENWISQSNIPNTAYYSIFFTSAESGYACGYNKVIKTTNSGLNWYSVTPDTLLEFSSIYFINTSTGFLTADNRIYKTTDYGLNWSKQYFNSNSEKIYSNYVKFINNNTGYIIGSYKGGGQFIKTTNCGTTWMIPAVPTVWGSGFYDLWLKNSDTIFIVGSDGLIIKSSNGGNSFGIYKLNQSIPDKFSLSQNYPNPFNPTTIIRFTIPPNVKGEKSNVKLVVYDILGKEIAALVNEKLSAGEYETTFNGSRLTSGIYFYRLTYGDYSETKKMLLLK